MNDKIETQSFRAVKLVFLGYAGINIIFLGFLFLNHMSFPLNLEAMELTVLEHVEKFIHGVSIYPNPSSNFVPLAYNPLYYILASVGAAIFGHSLFSLRVVSVLGFIGVLAVVYFATRRETGSKWWAWIAIGMIAASYRAMDTYLDNAHADSWALFMVLLGTFFLGLDRGRRTNTIGIFVLSLSFWFKQPAWIFIVGGLAFLVYRESLAKSWSYIVLAAILGPGIYFLAPSWFGENFHYYTLEIPRSWMAFSSGSIKRLIEYILRYYAFIAATALGAFLHVIIKRERKLDIWTALLPIACFSGLIALLDSESNNNVLIPMGVWFIMVGIFGLKRWIGGRELYIDKWLLPLIIVALTFLRFAYNPFTVIIPQDAGTVYQEMIDYVQALDGQVYAPWIGPLPHNEIFSPRLHWVPLTDIFRGTGEEGIDQIVNNPAYLELLGPVIAPAGDAYILTSFPLESDPALSFLIGDYILVDDLEYRFASLNTLPKRYNLGWPRYLYQYSP